MAAMPLQANLADSEDEAEAEDEAWLRFNQEAEPRRAKKLGSFVLLVLVALVLVSVMLCIEAMNDAELEGHLQTLREVVELQQEEKALAEAAELVDNTRIASEANVARRAMASTEAAESRGDLLQEEEARLKEEVSTLKFSLKETKRFQHKRVQELNTQVQKLEKQKQRLEEQQVARLWTEEESDGQRAELQQLNEKLKAQVREARQERDAKLSNAGALREELSRLQAQNASKSEKMQMGQEHLDELAEENGAARREHCKLQGRVNLISQQVDALEQTSVQTRDQWQETEESLQRANDEKGGAERKAEI